MATLKSNIPQVIAGIERRARRARQTTAETIRADIEAQMQAPKSGRTYKRQGRTHQASAPGEAPAIDTGSYAATIQVAEADEQTVAVGTADERGPVLEFGGANMEARPHFGPAFARSRERLAEEMGDIFAGE